MENYVVKHCSRFCRCRIPLALALPKYTDPFWVQVLATLLQGSFDIGWEEIGGKLQRFFLLEGRTLRGVPHHLPWVPRVTVPQSPAVWLAPICTLHGCPPKEWAVPESIWASSFPCSHHLPPLLCQHLKYPPAENSLPGLILPRSLVPWGFSPPAQILGYLYWPHEGTGQVWDLFVSCYCWLGFQGGWSWPAEPLHMIFPLPLANPDSPTRTCCFLPCALHIYMGTV